MPLIAICGVSHDASERVFLVEVALILFCDKCSAVWRNLMISGDEAQCMGL